MKIIEKGFEGYRKMAMHKDAPPIQIDECRKAFFSGAAILFASIINMLDSDSEPTEKDLKMLDAIYKELESFGAALDKEFFGPNEH